MDELLYQLITREEELEQVIRTAEKALKKAPSGHLRVEKNKHTYQYYVRNDPRDTHGTYIKKENKDYIQSLAQKDYNQKLLRVAKEEKAKLQPYLAFYQQRNIEGVLESMSLPRRELIIPYKTTDEEFINQWMKIDYEPKYIEQDSEDGIYTEKGEAVRSKSEKILADKFTLLGIPYHYEKPLKLSGVGTIYPDFTLLNVRTRRTVYLEHFGLIDMPEYRDKAIKKVEAMQRNGIFLGESLIVTCESQTHPLNMKYVDGLIEKFLL